MFNELLKNVMNLGIITDDDVKRLTAIELMLLIIERSNGLLTYLNSYVDSNDKRIQALDEKYKRITDEIKQMIEDSETYFNQIIRENLESIAIAQLNEWITDGTLGALINETLLQNINDKVDANTNELTRISKQLKVNVLDFGAKGDGVTDDTQAFQDAIDSLPTCTMTAYFKPSTMSGKGGTIFIPAGKYLIKGTIKYKGFITFKGEGFDSLLLHRPTDNCHLFDSDLSKASCNHNVLNVLFEDLAMEGDYNVADNTGHSDTGINMFNVGLTRVNRCFIGFFKKGVYYNWDMEHAGGFYNVMTSSSLRSCGLALDLEYDQFTVTDTNIAIPPSNVYSDYAVKAMGGGICLTNCAIEGQVNKALYYLKGCGTSIQGGYTENNREGSAYAEIDLSSQMFGGVSINQLFTNPLIKFVNLYSPSDYTTSYPRSTGISINSRGVYLPIVQNGSFLNNDTSNWVANNPDYFEGAIVGAGQPFVKRSYRMTKTTGDKSCSMRQNVKINVPNAFVTCVVKMNADCIPFLNVFDSTNKLKSMQKLADYGNGWYLYGVWLPVKNRETEYTIGIGIAGESPVGSTIEFTNIGVYNNGIEYFPTN